MEEEKRVGYFSEYKAHKKFSWWACILFALATFIGAIFWFIYTIVPFFRSATPDWVLSMCLTFATILSGYLSLFMGSRISKGFDKWLSQKNNKSEN